MHSVRGGLLTSMVLSSIVISLFCEYRSQLFLLGLRCRLLGFRTLVHRLPTQPADGVEHQDGDSDPDSWPIFKGRPDIVFGTIHNKNTLNWRQARIN